jgi:hypothetical protein
MSIQCFNKVEDHLVIGSIKYCLGNWALDDQSFIPLHFHIQRRIMNLFAVLDILPS